MAQAQDTDPGPAGIILAGGRGRRMGGADKALCRLGGRTLGARVRDRLRPQVPALALNANGDPARFAALGLPVIPDTLPDGGPLAGVLAGLDWAASLGATRLLTAAADTPFLPCDLLHRLAAAGTLPAYAATAEGAHPTAALWPVALRDALRAELDDGTRRMREAMDRLGAVPVPFPDPAAFFNVNTPEDLAMAETFP
ncbi:molybdenum cofactor guanylyltransferase MobA [Histidinibacterium lentulum]|uniref:Molybdenum cofactor guanylyltransferase n=2 Tax=Histidinibacterium lentulum TaxID=2480588 RepID=A0A3N2R5D1_9RHOB|nr:molybdenum cofactor guanylyltransferase MobA [Histidinibacterium lentulum]